MKDSIKDKGIEDPITVRRVGKDQYIIIDGERRFRAGKMAGLKRFPCIIIEKMSNPEILERQLRQDCLKEKLTPLEQGEAIYRHWKSLGTLSEEEIKNRFWQFKDITNFEI